MNNLSILLISPEKWGPVQLSKHHYAKYLSKNNTVYFLNPSSPIGLFSRIKLNLKKTKISPSLIIIDYNNYLPRLNYFPKFIQYFIYNLQARKIQKFIQSKVDIVWTFDPFRYWEQSVWHAPVTIYHSVDVHFNKNYEKIIAKSSNLVFINSEILRPKLSLNNKRIFKINHGADIDHHISCKQKNITLPGNNKIKAGLIANFNNNIDFKLIEKIAIKNSTLDFIMIGPFNSNNLGPTEEIISKRITQLNALNNLFFVGEIHSDDIPSYLDNLDINLVLYKENKTWRSENQAIDGIIINPHKIMGYLFSGKVIVSSYIFEYAFGFTNLIAMSNKNEELPDLILNVSTNLAFYNSQKLMEARKSFAKSNSYDNQIAKISKIIDNEGYMNEIFFSIITSTFNRANLISKGIQSVLNQEFKHFEHIIIDDGSDDNTAEVIQSFNDPRLIYIKIENHERGYARNIGIKSAKGSYITFLDSDDYFLSNHLLEASYFINKFNQPTFFFQKFKAVNAMGEVVHVVKYPQKNIIENFCYINPTCPMGAFVRRDIMTNNLFNEDYNFTIAEDFYVWLKIACNHGIQFNNVVTGVLVTHEFNTMNNLNPGKVIYCRDKLIQLLKEDVKFKSQYSSCFKNLFSNQTSLAILSATRKGDYRFSLAQLITLLTENYRELLRKRTIVIFRNIIINYFNAKIDTIKNLITEDIWHIVKVNNSSLEHLLNSSTSIAIEPIPNDPGSYYADPFSFTKNGITIILAEKFYLKKQIGEITAIELSESKKTSSPYFKLDKHLSYPSIFSFNGVEYFLFEGIETNALDLYQLTDNQPPKKIKTIFNDIKAVDPNFYFDGNYIWLSFTDGNNLINGTLYLYYAKDIMDAFLPHKMNPVKFDKSNARSGGKWFTINGKLYRPAQNCAKTYGGSLKINQILQLTPEIYSEKLVTEITPSRLVNQEKTNDKINGVHTLTTTNDKVFMDIKSTMFTPQKPINLFLKKINKLLHSLHG